MKILQINAVYGHGSTGIIVRDLEQICEDRGIECYVASQDKNVCKSKRGYHIGNIIDYKLHALLCRIAGKQAYFSKRSTRKLLEYIDKVSPDIVHMHIIHNNYIHLNLLLEYLAENKIKTVVTLHDCWFFTGGCFHYTNVGCDKWKTKCEKCVKRWKDTPAYLYDASNEILKDRIKYFSAIQDITFVGCSKWIASEIAQSKLKNFGEITYIHNGFDLQTFSPRLSKLKEKLGLEGKFVVLGPASKWLQSINKNELDYFTRNLPQNGVLLLFGTKNIEVKMPHNVMLYGYTRNRIELAELYSMADVMVNCSREDTLSSINLECQACGTPVITYDATGSKETVDEKSGFAVSTGDVELLFSQMMLVHTNGKKYYSDNCRRFIENNFEKKNNYLKYINLYQSLTSKNNRTFNI